MSIGQPKTRSGRRFGGKRDRSHRNAATREAKPLYEQLKWEVVLGVGPMLNRKVQMEGRAVRDWDGPTSTSALLEGSDQPRVGWRQTQLACANEEHMPGVEGQAWSFWLDR